MRLIKFAPFFFFQVTSAYVNYSVKSTENTFDLYFEGYCWLGPRRSQLHHVHCNMSTAAASAIVDTNVPEQQPSVPSTQVVLAAPPPDTFVIPFYFSLSGARPSRSFIPAEHQGVQARLALFESVTLVQADFSIHLSAGTNRRVLACVTGSNAAPGTIMSGFPRLFLEGAQQFGVDRMWELPANHTYGREIRSLAIGNPAPRFHFTYIGGPPGNNNPDVVVHGTIVVRPRGAGVPVPLEI